MRVPHTNQHAPLYVARQLAQCPSDWCAALRDPIRYGQGIVLTASDHALALPNAHQARELDCLLLGDHEGARSDQDLLDRLLCGTSSSGSDSDYFDHRTGVLRLAHLPTEKTFTGVQKSVIATFWKAREQLSLKWSDVVAWTGCSKDPDSVFGKGAWQQWLERVAHGRYRIRTRRHLR